MLYRACWRLGAIAAPSTTRWARPTSRACSTRSQPQRSSSTISTRCPAGDPVDERLDRPATRLAARAVHLGLERHAEGRAAHPGDARVQGRADARRARARARRLRAHARARRAHLRAAQRRHAARRASRSARCSWRAGIPERALDADRARAGHVHGRAADVLRLDDAGARVLDRHGSRACGSISSGGAGVSEAFVDRGRRARSARG